MSTARHSLESTKLFEHNDPGKDVMSLILEVPLLGRLWYTLMNLR